MAGLVVGINLCNIVFMDVPASDPFNAFCANTASPVLTSSKVNPKPPATLETCDKAYFISRTSVAEALAAPANKLATFVESFILNAFIDVLIISAASGKDKSPAAAKSKADCEASPNTSFTLIPAFNNSVMPCAASNAENLVLLPSSNARCRINSISAPCIPVSAFILLISAVKSIDFLALLVIKPLIPTAPAPIPNIPNGVVTVLLTLSNPEETLSFNFIVISHALDVSFFNLPSTFFTVGSVSSLGFILGSTVFLAIFSNISFVLFNLSSIPCVSNLGSILVSENFFITVSVFSIRSSNFLTSSSIFLSLAVSLSCMDKTSFNL